MKSRAERAAVLRPIVQAKIEETTVRVAEAEICVSRTALHNFAKGDTPQERTLTKIEAWADAQGINLDSSTPLAPADGEQQRLTAWVIGLGVPGENGTRKLEGLERYEKMLAAFRQPVPDWWYELKQRVEANEL